MFLVPDMCLSVYDARLETHRCSQKSSLGLVIICVSGWLSLHTVNECPFSQWLNFSHTLHLSAKNSSLWAGYRIWDLLKNWLANAMGRTFFTPTGTWDNTASRPSREASVDKMSGWEKSGRARTAQFRRPFLRFKRASSQSEVQSAGWSLQYVSYFASTLVLPLLFCPAVRAKRGFALEEQSGMKCW